jgi:S1-C subfamily serine protease
VSKFKPGDKIPVVVERGNKKMTFNVTLKNKAGNYDVVTKDAKIDLLGADFIDLNSGKAKEYGITGGVIVKQIKEGVLNDQTRMKDGFVILKINDKVVNNVADMKKILADQNSVNITGFYPGFDGLYEYPVTLD